MSKTITRKKSKQKEIDPKFGYLSGTQQSLMLDKPDMGLMNQGHILEEELGEIKLRRKHMNLDKGKGKQILLSLYLHIPLQIPWILMRPKKLINK